MKLKKPEDFFGWFTAASVVGQGIMVLIIVGVVIFFWPEPNNKVSGVNTNTIEIHNDILADHETRIKELEEMLK